MVTKRTKQPKQKKHDQQLPGIAGRLTGFVIAVNSFTPGLENTRRLMAVDSN